MAVAKYSFRWFGDQTRALVGAAYVDRLRQMGEYLVARVRRNISVPAPPPSRPGEFPHTDTGELRRLTGYWLDAKALRLSIVNYAAYALWLELTAGRSFLRRTLYEEYHALRAMATRGGLLRRRA